MPRPVVKRKNDTVKLDGLAPAGFLLISACVLAARATSLPLTITCGTEGHAPTDPHTLGEAIDLSVAGLSPSQILVIKAALELAISTLTDAPFTVLYETSTKPEDTRLAAVAYINSGASAPHFHLQRKRNTTYPGNVNA